MLHEILKITRPLFIVDTETTGTNPQEDRIVEIGFQQWGPDGPVKEWRQLINPGVPIPPGATAVHGITDEMVKDAYTFAQLAPNLARGFSACDYGGQNIRFDLGIIFAEMSRAKTPWEYTSARIIDSSRLETLALPRSLSHLYKKYTGTELDGAHGTLADVKASAVVMAAQLKEHAVLPRDMDRLHELQWPGFIDAAGLFRTVNGEPTVTFGKWRNRPMRHVDRDYWVWMAKPKSGFTEEVRGIAQKASLGEFPS